MLDWVVVGGEVDVIKTVLIGQRRDNFIVIGFKFLIMWEFLRL